MQSEVNSAKELMFSVYYLTCLFVCLSVNKVRLVKTCGGLMFMKLSVSGQVGYHMTHEGID